MDVRMVLLTSLQDGLKLSRVSEGDEEDKDSGHSSSGSCISNSDSERPFFQDATAAAAAEAARVRRRSANSGQLGIASMPFLLARSSNLNDSTNEDDEEEGGGNDHYWWAPATPEEAAATPPASPLKTPQKEAKTKITDEGQDDNEGERRHGGLSATSMNENVQNRSSDCSRDDAEHGDEEGEEKDTDHKKCEHSMEVSAVLCDSGLLLMSPSKNHSAAEDTCDHTAASTADTADTAAADSSGNVPPVTTAATAAAAAAAPVLLSIELSELMTEHGMYHRPKLEAEAALLNLCQAAAESMCDGHSGCSGDNAGDGAGDGGGGGDDATSKLGEPRTRGVLQCAQIATVTARRIAATLRVPLPKARAFCRAVQAIADAAVDASMLAESTTAAEGEAAAEGGESGMKSDGVECGVNERAAADCTAAAAPSAAPAAALTTDPTPAPQSPPAITNNGERRHSLGDLSALKHSFNCCDDDDDEHNNESGTCYDGNGDKHFDYERESHQLSGLDSPCLERSLMASFHQSVAPPMNTAVDTTAAGTSTTEATTAGTEADRTEGATSSEIDDTKTASNSPNDDAARPTHAEADALPHSVGDPTRTTTNELAAVGITDSPGELVCTSEVNTSAAALAAVHTTDTAAAAAAALVNANSAAAIATNALLFGARSPSEESMSRLWTPIETWGSPRPCTAAAGRGEGGENAVTTGGSAVGSGGNGVIHDGNNDNRAAAAADSTVLQAPPPPLSPALSDGSAAVTVDETVLFSPKSPLLEDAPPTVEQQDDDTSINAEIELETQLEANCRADSNDESYTENGVDSSQADSSGEANSSSGSSDSSPHVGGVEPKCSHTPTHEEAEESNGAKRHATSSGTPVPSSKTTPSKPLRSLRKTVARATGLSGFFSRKYKRSNGAAAEDEEEEEEEVEVSV